MLSKPFSPSWKPLRVLGIETSCDETAVALLSFSPKQDGVAIEIRKHLVSSQIPLHQPYGGVVPEVAARSHVPEVIGLTSEALGSDGMDAFDTIAVTKGPGLPTALAIGLETGRTLAMVSGKPLIGVNHLEGHLASAWLNEENRKAWQFPLLALVVSGGHTELVLLKNFCDYEILGETRDDAAGEAFDKSAKLVGLPYPGGPEIAKRAKDGDPNAFVLPKPLLKDGSFDFSFSGLKTAVRLAWEKIPEAKRTDKMVADLAASVQATIVDILVQKTMAAAVANPVHGILLVGGVSANLALREAMEHAITKYLPGVAFLPSDRAYITDNAAMIAAAGYWRMTFDQPDAWQTIDTQPDLGL